MRRYASVIRLRPEREAEYLRLHAAVWPAVLAQIRRSNIRNYSIFLRDGQLFAYYEYVGDDHDADLARVAEDPVTREWWTHTDPCQVRIVDERVPGALWQPLDEVWHLS